MYPFRNPAALKIRPKTLLLSASLVGATLLNLLTGCSRPEPSIKVFEDVTLNSGLQTYRGMTFGAAWGDIDGDGRPDLYVTNHLNPVSAKLFRNLGQGRFEDVTEQWFTPNDLDGDKHGAAWADFNNDGRLDLVQLTGAKSGVGAEPKRLFLNHGQRFENVAEAWGVANPYGRTRMPLWVDLNRDGRLDLFHGAETRFDDRTPPFIFLQQQDGRFLPSEDMVKFASRGAPFCILTELTQDAYPELVCRVMGKDRTAQIFDTASQPARELDWLPVTAFEDLAAADFDNNGLIDLYLARRNPSGAIAFGRSGSNELIADVQLDRNHVDQPSGFSFRSTGSLDVQVTSAYPTQALTAEHISLGQQGQHPGSLTFTLSAETAGIEGMPAYQPGDQTRMLIGFTPPDQWQIALSGDRQLLTSGKSKNRSRLK